MPSGATPHGLPQPFKDPSMRPLLLILPLTLASTAVAACAQDLQNPDSAIEVVNASISTFRTEGPLLTTVIGELHNTTNDRIDELVIEARLTDASGKLIDVISEPVYGLVAPAGQNVAFRLQAQAAAAAEAYAGVSVRVISAQTHPPAPARARAPEPSRIPDWLMAWWPMLLFILIWLLLVRKASGKGSFQERMLAGMQEQNALLGRQVSALEAIASKSGTADKADGG
ncbi:MAG: hypothetical protein EKK65_08540 [Lysobacterales bacterium]|nr:MAG: hypothetical protein EKK65_08540 [Xanthomonadales bacterium]